MADPYMVTNLADVLGFLLEDVVKFVMNFFAGWMFMLSMLTLGFMLIVYFRFFKTIPNEVVR